MKIPIYECVETGCIGKRSPSRYDETMSCAAVKTFQNNKSSQII